MHRSISAIATAALLAVAALGSTAAVSHAGIGTGNFNPAAKAPGPAKPPGDAVTQKGKGPAAKEAAPKDGIAAKGPNGKAKP